MLLFKIEVNREHTYQQCKALCKDYKNWPLDRYLTKYIRWLYKPLL